MFYNVSSDYTMCMLNISQWKSRYPGGPTNDKGHFLPRMLWLKKDWTLKELHLYVFKTMRMCLQEWVDWTDPKTEKQPKDASKKDLRKTLIPFPYRINADVPMTKADFKALSDEEAFKLCFPGVLESDGAIESDPNFDMKDKPYQLMF